MTEIATFMGWSIQYDPAWYENRATVFVTRPGNRSWERNWSVGDRLFRRDYTLPELLLLAMTYIQKEELLAAQRQNEVAVAKDLAQALIHDGLLESAP